MTHIDFMIYKFLAVVGIFFIVNFIYTLITGKTIEESRRDKEN